MTVASKRRKPVDFVADPPRLLVPESTPEIQSEPRGVRCPDCNCADLRVYRTRPKPNGKIVRERICRHCGRRVVTTEQEAFKNDGIA